MCIRDSIEIIPDEQEAIATALAMGRHGDLLLVFADALTRSWKQVIKFKPAVGAGVAAEPRPPKQRGSPAAGSPAGGSAAAASPGTVAPPEDESSVFAVQDDVPLESQGFVRDERGLRFVGEAAD